MKKLTTMIVSLIMAVVMAMFVGCGNNDDKETGVIKGNYKEASAEEVATQLNDVDMSKLFGDTEAEDWVLGLSVYFDCSVTEENKVEDVEEKTTSAINFKYDLGIKNDEIVGKGSVSTDMPDEETGENVKSSITLYNDSSFIYMESAEEKIKLSFEQIMLKVNEMLPPVEEEGDEDGGEMDISIVDTLDILAEMGVTFAMDTGKDGIKIKLSFDENILSALGGMLMMADEESESIFDTFVCDLYLHINEKDQLVAFTANIEIAMDTDDTSSTSMSAVMAIRVTKVPNIKLPTGIETDTTYTEKPLDHILNGI